LKLSNTTDPFFPPMSKNTPAPLLSLNTQVLRVKASNLISPEKVPKNSKIVAYSNFELVFMLKVFISIEGAV